MVFANLQEREKDAFFSLLDEYFQSRPEISAALSGHAGNSNSKSSGPTIGQRLFSSAATAAASGGSPKPRMGGIGGGGFSSGGGRVVCRFSSSDLVSLSQADSGGELQSDATSQEQQEESLAPVAGRVAAAAAAFSQHRLSTPSGSSSSGPGGMTNKLSGVDTSSLKNALAGRTSQAGPPPAYNKSSASAPPPVARRGPPQPEPEEEEEQEPQGGWADVLYDYVSDEPGDLNIRENQQILVTEKNSDDWWTGEVDGQSGLFPASYVKLL
ncbi:SH3 domain-containing protein [Amanita rubescens]|nr:SH3 domain-containing protein [Amanita rubescens]